MIIGQLLAQLTQPDPAQLLVTVTGIDDDPIVIVDPVLMTQYCVLLTDCW